MNIKAVSSAIICCLVSMLMTACNSVTKEEKEPIYATSVPKPTHAAISYGSHKRHVMDFWKSRIRITYTFSFGHSWRWLERWQ